LAAVSYLPVLSAEFVWDDYALIVDNPLVRRFSDIAAIFGQPFLAARPNAYHPLVALTYLTDFQVWRLDPVGYHTTNLTLHLVATLLVFTIAAQLLRRRDMAFAAGAVFAAHPVHVQSVAWVAGRPQPLATCLALFAFLAYSYYVQSFAGPANARRRTLAYYWLGVLAFTLGLFAHASVAALLALLPLYEATLARQRLSVHRRAWFVLPYLGFVAGGALYLLGRRWALGYQLAPGLDVAAWPAHLYTAPLWAVRALELLILPVRSQPYYPVALLDTPLRLDFLTAAAALAVVITLAVRASTVSPVVAFAAWWTLLTLIPVLNFIPLPTPQFAERDLYLPSVGLAIILGWAVISATACAAARGRRWMRALIVAVFAAAIGLGIGASRQRALWYRDEVTLFTRMVRAAPGSALAHFNLGGAYLVRGDTKAAIREYRRAIALRPTARAYHNLGNAYMAAGSYGEAAEAYRAALLVEPGSQASAQGLRKALEAQGAEVTPNAGGPAKPGRGSP
jgi:tetratricopeptide (TPR) repeat protein